MRVGRQAVIVMAMGVCPALSSPALTTGPTVQPVAKKPAVEVGKEVCVDVLIENAPAIYGADMRMVFDPRMLEVVDADPKVPGVQIEPGSFLDSKRSFALLHRVSNETGEVEYALTLVRPAPAVSGDGQLAQITFRGKVVGRTTMFVKQGQFGTATGQVVNATPGSVEIEVFEKGGHAKSAVGRAVGTLAEKVSAVVVSPEPAQRIGLVVAGGVLVGLLGFWLGRRKG